MNLILATLIGMNFMHSMWGYKSLSAVLLVWLFRMLFMQLHERDVNKDKQEKKKVIRGVNT